MVYLYLLVVEFIDILAIRKGRLCSISILEIVNYYSVRKYLFQVFILEIHNSVAVLKYLSSIRI
jgi:hypothetical protein